LIYDERQGLRGEENPKAKLTESQVAEIQIDLVSGLSQRAIAKKFDICQSNVSAIKTGKTWVHLQAHGHKRGA